MITTDLLGEGIRIQTPFIKVTIGDYTFGVYQEGSGVEKNSDGIYTYRSIQYPNYIQTLEIEKINGQVNTYTLNISYPVGSNDDPNFFEKVFSSVSGSRKIVFSYGDLNAPAFVYREEEAIITGIQKQHNLSSANMTYVITAMSGAVLAASGAFQFPGYQSAKPSDIIKKILKQNNIYGLQDIFTGMRDVSLVLEYGLIASDDRAVTLEAKRNISVLEYISYLVDCMESAVDSSGIYTFVVVDDTTDVFGGPYFKVINSDSAVNSLDTYELDIGFDRQTNNAITQYTVDDNEEYAIYFEYLNKISTNEYVQEIDDDGNLINVYAGLQYSTEDGTAKINEQTWWKNMTSYPISVTITMRGLLRPAILMSKLKLNIYYYGKKSIDSGTYIITKQIDSIGVSGGYYTTLYALRIEGDSDYY